MKYVYTKLMLVLSFGLFCVMLFGSFMLVGKDVRILDPVTKAVIGYETYTWGSVLKNYLLLFGVTSIAFVLWGLLSDYDHFLESKKKNRMVKS